MMITTRTAAVRARDVTKRTGYFRQTISELSKAEENGDSEARASRQLTTADFERRRADADLAIDQTRLMSTLLQRAASALAGGRTAQDDPLTRAAVRCRRLVLSKGRRAALIQKMTMAAAQADKSADRAADRLSDAHDDVEAASALGDLLERLSVADFRKSDPDVSKARSRYQRHQNAQRQKMKGR